LDRKPAIEVLFRAYDAELTKAGFLAMGGQIIDATIIAAPKQRNTDGEKAEIRAGRIPEAWKDKPAKLAQKDRDARWTVKFSKAKPSDDGSPRIDLAVPAFGYKNHIAIDRRPGRYIRTRDTMFELPLQAFAARRDYSDAALIGAMQQAGVWFPEPVHEMCIRSERYDQEITVLQFEADGPRFQAEEEEMDVLDRFEGSGRITAR